MDGPIHRCLGLDVGLIIPGDDDRRATSARSTPATSPTARTTSSASTTSATTWRRRRDDKVQRGHVYAIVDEVDSILIDEARTPLIISGRVADAAKLYYQFASIVRGAQARRRLRGRRGEAHGRSHSRRASSKVEQRARRRQPLRRGRSRTSSTSCQAALKAKELYKRDKDYIVQDGEVKIVDEFTGRILEGRRWSRGPPPGGRGQGRREDQGGEPDPRHDHPPELLPHVRQARRHDRHGRRPRRPSSLNTYDLQVVPIPTNRPMVRVDQRRPDLQDRGRQVRRGRRRHRRALRDRPAGARRHGLGREVRAAVAHAREARHPPRGAQRQAAHPGGRHRRPGRPARRGHRRHQHGRPRRRHPPRRQPRGPGPPTRCSREGARPRRVRGGHRPRYAGELLRQATRTEMQGRGRQGPRARRPLRARHRAPREPPHRQPAARPLRPPGRPRREPLLPVASTTSSCACSPPAP